MSNVVGFEQYKISKMSLVDQFFAIATKDNFTVADEQRLRDVSAEIGLTTQDLLEIAAEAAERATELEKTS